MKRWELLSLEIMVMDSEFSNKGESTDYTIEDFFSCLFYIFDRVQIFRYISWKFKGCEGGMSCDLCVRDCCLVFGVFLFATILL